jgi:hypothetical protein
MSAMCRTFDIPRKTGDKIFNRNREEGLEARRLLSSAGTFC